MAQPPRQLPAHGSWGPRPPTAPKPSAPKLGSQPSPGRLRTLLAARAELTPGHSSCRSCSCSQPVPAAGAGAALPCHLWGTAGPTSRYSTRGCSATFGTFGILSIPQPRRPPHGQQPALSSIPALACLLPAREPLPSAAQTPGATSPAPPPSSTAPPRGAPLAPRRCSCPLGRQPAHPLPMRLAQSPGAQRPQAWPAGCPCRLLRPKPAPSAPHGAADGSSGLPLPPLLLAAAVGSQPLLGTSALSHGAAPLPAAAQEGPEGSPRAPHTNPVPEDTAEELQRIALLPGTQGRQAAATQLSARHSLGHRRQPSPAVPPAPPMPSKNKSRRPNCRRRASKRPRGPRSCGDARMSPAAAPRSATSAWSPQSCGGTWGWAWHHLSQRWRRRRGARKGGRAPHQGPQQAQGSGRQHRAGGEL